MKQDGRYLPAAGDLRQLIDAADGPSFGIDIQGRLNEWNHKAVDATGYSKKDVLGRDLVNCFIAKEFRVGVKQVLDLALTGKDTTNFGFSVVTRAGARVDLLLNATARRDEAGQIVGVVGVGQDVTERKQAEREFSRVAQDLRQLIDTANAPIFGIDKDGLVNEWNNKAAEITGYAQTEVLNQHLVENFITDEYKEQVKDVLDKALQGQETANFEFPLFTKEGARVEVLLNATTRRDAAGAIVGVVGVGQDITERKQAEKGFAGLAQELRQLIDAANAPIFGIDKDGL
eukprot:scaffold2663_cov353-Prasinococcus_capsulatus_cf.AAC.8